jgi:hypothetical protein
MDNNQYRCIRNEGGYIDTSNVAKLLINTTGISSLKNDMMVTIYPSPAEDKLIISNTQKLNGANIIITDMIGRKMLEENITSATNEYALFVSGLKPGSYIFTIQKDGETSRIKFIKE